MALCCPPCLGGAKTLLRLNSNPPLITSWSDNFSVSFQCETFFWATRSKRYQHRRHWNRVIVPFQLQFEHFTKPSWRLKVGPTASLAQSSRTIFTSEARSSSATLLSFSYAPPMLSSENRERDGDGGGKGERALKSSTSVDSREKKRRERIAHANKGKVPWNKGKSHSPETIEKIRQKTKLAMLNPQVRERLRQCGKNQSSETKAKIREKMVGIWNTKKMIKLAQESCCKEWKEVIANAARLGDPDDEEHDWNTYRRIKEQYKQEDLKVARQAKRAETARKRAELKAQRGIGCSDAHRKAISDAIKAKWEDPEYRSRVFAGMRKSDPVNKRLRPQRTSPSVSTKKKVASLKASKTVVAIPEEYHLLVEKKKLKQSALIDEDFIAEVLAEEVTAQTRSERSTAARIKGPQKVTLVSLGDHDLVSGDDQEAASVQSQSVKVGEIALNLERKIPCADDTEVSSFGSPEGVQLSKKLSQGSYKDPFVNEKLQTIRQLREGRLEVQLKRKEAADRARMLIADAERAASALERAAKTDKATMATLIETRRLLAAATRSMQAAEVGWTQATNIDLSTVNHMSSSDKSRFSRLEVQHEENVASSIGSDFHSRVWTQGNKLVDCPHPIPIRSGSLRTNEEYQLYLSQLDRSTNEELSKSDLSMRHQSLASSSQASSAAEVDKTFPSAGSWKVEESCENIKNRDGTQGLPDRTHIGKKRWLRGRLVAVDEDERT